MRTDYYNDPAAPNVNTVVPAATAVVVDQDRILLVHRVDNDRWALPGGGHDPGETIEQTIVRELLEETGIEIEVTGLVGIYSDPNHVIAYDDGEVRQQFSICFRARPVGGELSGNDESKEVRWVPVADLDGLDVHPTMRLRITHGLDLDRTQPYLG